MPTDNKTWNLEDFVDSLVVELDKTRETLAIKSINKALSYSVKDMTLDLNIFPSFDGDQVQFITAQPGQEGASKVTIQLGSITDQQVRATTKMKGSKNDINIDEIDIDKATKRKLRKIGVTSVNDIKEIEKKDVDLGKASDNFIDYTKLANQIQKSRRNQAPPKVHAVSLSLDDEKMPYILVKGENLAVNPKFNPVAVVNSTLAEVMHSSENEMKIQINQQHSIAKSNELIITFDPFAIVKMNINV